jgi:hypothetical protein
MARGEASLLLLAVALFITGALPYYRHGNFSLEQAGYCLLAILASLVVLLVFDYTLHHAKIVAVMVLIFVVLFLVASPAFCVGMGLGLAGMGRNLKIGKPENPPRRHGGTEKERGLTRDCTRECDLVLALLFLGELPEAAWLRLAVSGSFDSPQSPSTSSGFLGSAQDDKREGDRYGTSKLVP